MKNLVKRHEQIVVRNLLENIVNERGNCIIQNNLTSIENQLI